jgi:hypothetical protein
MPARRSKRSSQMSQGKGFQDCQRIPRSTRHLAAIPPTFSLNCQESSATNLCYSVLHNLLILHIALVTDEKLVNTLCGVTVDFLQPLLDIVERVHIGHIVNHTNPMGTAVVRRGDRSEAFLAGGIPLESGESVIINNQGGLSVNVRFEASQSCHQAQWFEFSRIDKHSVFIYSWRDHEKTSTYKVNANGGDVTFGVSVVSET